MSIFIARKKMLSVATAIAMLGSAPACNAADAQQGLPVAAEASVEYLAQKRIELGEPDTAELRNRIRDDLTTQRLLSEQATRKGLENSADVKAQIELNQLAVLSKAYLDDYFRNNPVTEAMVEADYEQRRKAGAIREYRVRHLSVTTEALARELLDKVEKGGNLVQLARENSTDPSAEANGGDIGWFRPDIFVDERFATAVAGLGKGETTKEPVKTRFGWHIIRVEDGPRQVADLPPYAKVEANLQKILREKMMKRVLEQHIATLKNSESTARGADVTRISRIQ